MAPFGGFGKADLCIDMPEYPKYRLYACGESGFSHLWLPHAKIDAGVRKAIEAVIADERNSVKS